MHTVASNSSDFQPCGHSEHIPVSILLKVPVLHGVRSHLALPSSAFLPTPQDTHSEDPSTSDFVLTAQSVQSLLEAELLFGFFFPAAHLLQSFKLETPLAEEYVPDGHVLQDSTDI
jgi:hypothetical protein